MNLIVTSGLWLLSLVLAPNSSTVPQVLNEYIQWTTTGQMDPGRELFDRQVNLTCEVEPGKFAAVPFDKYRRNLADGAVSAPRSMAVLAFERSGSEATARLSDLSEEGDFSLVHVLRLRKRSAGWRIYAIRILFCTE